jgi:tRNA threonylcarbamoyladenosine biosynthesis protein TsaB
MTTLLAIDASTSACSVALMHEGHVYEDFRMLPRAHTRFLLPMVDEMLAEHSLPLAQMDALVFTAGPGSFTGLRVAIATVQGLAFAAELPVVPVSTLAAMAQFYAEREGVAEGAVILPALDARMDEVYFGRYQYRDGVVAPLNADQLLPPEQVGNTAVATAGVGDGWTYAERFGDAQPAIVDQAILPSAAAALKLAKPDVLAGKVLPAEQAQPVYLRESVAWKKQ